MSDPNLDSQQSTLSSDDDPFRLPLRRWLAEPIERLTGLRKISRLYQARPAEARGSENAHEFLSYSLKTLDAFVEPEDFAALGNIPAEGPVIFVCNHPLGALEGLAMTEILLHLRPDTKVLTNELLTRVPELKELFIGVDVLGANTSAANAGGVRGLYKHLRNGGAVLIYPSGEVSGFNTSSGSIEDPTWHPLVGRLARRYNADCVPFYVLGRNSWWFYFLGVLHPFLRTLRLPREMLNKRGVRFKLLVGRVVKSDYLKSLRSDKEATGYLRKSSELLKQQAHIKGPHRRVIKAQQKKERARASQSGK